MSASRVRKTALFQTVSDTEVKGNLENEAIKNATLYIKNFFEKSDLYFAFRGVMKSFYFNL